MSLMKRGNIEAQLKRRVQVRPNTVEDIEEVPGSSDVSTADDSSSNISQSQGSERENDLTVRHMP